MPSDFLINFHQKHFTGTDVSVYSKEVFYKLLEEINKLEEKNIEGHPVTKLDVSRSK